MKHSVNVRTIAETYFEGGDITSFLSSSERMQEGLIGHLLQQNTYTTDYRAEVPVKLEVQIENINLLVQGRVDGLLLKNGFCLVEEIKTTRYSPSSIGLNDYPVHWAQAEIYAHMLAQLHQLDRCTVRLLYMNLTGERKAFEREYSNAELANLFFKYVRVYVQKLLREDNWLNLSLPSLKTFHFPFESFRDGQKEMALAVYHAIKNRTKLLVEAPTGIGKTTAALFPAIKALGEGITDIVFYLTARSTGRLAAENALRLMRSNGLKIRSVSICAKRKLCTFPSFPCDPEHCPRAKGHFDRQKIAFEEMWNESAYDEAAIRHLSDQYDLCPFELTLSLSETAQVIICDYNYVFDPKVRLKRFFDRSGRYTVLIDEAHNLIDRSRDMFSADIGAEEVRLLRHAVGANEGKDCELYACLSSILKTLGNADESEARSELPLRTVEALKQFIDIAKEYLCKGSDYSKQLEEFFFRANDFLRVSGDFQEEYYKLMVTPEGKRNRFKLWCWDPTPRIRSILKRMYGTIMFSATLSPVEHYARLLSVDAEQKDNMLKLRSPFPRQNLLCLKMNVATRYSQRSDSALRVARIIHTLAQSKVGNYIACFPSHAYLELVYQLFLSIDPPISAIKQRQQMSEQERKAYLANFKTNPTQSMVAFIAMGGVFSEGIDLTGDRLIGAAIVGVGLPQISFEKEALRQLYDEYQENGFETAYVYPGIGKCLQAAGRVIRSDSDKGVVLFIDERYMKKEYKVLMPEHMKAKAVNDEELLPALKQFWNIDEV